MQSRTGTRSSGVDRGKSNTPLLKKCALPLAIVLSLAVSALQASRLRLFIQLGFVRLEVPSSENEVRSPCTASIAD
jgi:hypothetical protein